MCARPVRLAHLVHPTLAGLTYILFTLVYWALGNTSAIYPPVLDWETPVITTVWVSIFVQGWDLPLLLNTKSQLIVCFFKE